MSDTPRRHLVTPARAIAAACVACALLAGSIVWRWSNSATPEPVAALPAPATSPARDAGIADAHPHTAIAPLAPSAPPELRSIEATVSPADRGAVLALALSLHVAASSPDDMLTIRARCAIEGDWFDGSSSVMLDRVGSGDHTVTERIVVGSQYRLGATPTACHLRFEHFTKPIRKADERVIAIRCWNGHAVVDGRCPAIAAKPSLALEDVRVASSAGAGASTYLRVELDAQLARELDGWRLQVSADCALPGGARSDHATAHVGYLRPGKPFGERVLLFLGSRLAEEPTACTLRFELADAYDLAHEPLGERCWSKGKVTPGACAS